MFFFPDPPVALIENHLSHLYTRLKIHHFISIPANITDDSLKTIGKYICQYYTYFVHCPITYVIKYVKYSLSDLKIRVRPNDKGYYYANETSDIKLPCNIKTNGLGEEYTFHWRKDNKTFRPSDQKRMNVKRYRWLKIRKVRKDDAGLYTCVVTNKCGEMNSVSMLLYVGECK